MKKKKKEKKKKRENGFYGYLIGEWRRWKIW